MPERPLPETSIGRRPVAFAVALGVVAALLMALAGGRPSSLPGVALGSPAVLYVEKAAACFTAYLLFLVVLVRSFAGELPSELRGVRYEVGHESKGVADAIKEASAKEKDIERRLEYLESVVDDPHGAK
jgi:hypothetical protein